MVDSTGIIHAGRTDLNTTKVMLTQITNVDNLTGGLTEAVKGRDVFVGVSAA